MMSTNDANAPDEANATKKSEMDEPPVTHAMSQEYVSMTRAIPQQPNESLMAQHTMPSNMGPNNEWASDLYNTTTNPCCEPSELCCMATFCPSVVFGNNVHMLRTGQLLEPCSCVGCCNEECWTQYAISAFAAYLCNPYLGLISSWGLGPIAGCGMRYGWLAKFTARNSRLAVQANFNVKDKLSSRFDQGLCRESCQCCVTDEGCCGDPPEIARANCTHFWCNCCGVMQEYKTIKAAIQAQKQMTTMSPPDQQHLS